MQNLQYRGPTRWLKHLQILISEGVLEPWIWRDTVLWTSPILRASTRDTLDCTPSILSHLFHVGGTMIRFRNLLLLQETLYAFPGVSSFSGKFILLLLPLHMIGLGLGVRPKSGQWNLRRNLTGTLWENVPLTLIFFLWTALFPNANTTDWQNGEMEIIWVFKVTGEWTSLSLP